jgi:hypothetical protein
MAELKQTDVHKAIVPYGATVVVGRDFVTVALASFDLGGDWSAVAV